MIRRKSDETGAATTELVIATPLLLLLLLLIIQFALWQHANHVATAAAREGVRAARLEGATAGAGEQKTVQFLNEVGGATLVDSQVSVARDANVVQVNVTGYAEEVVPGMRLPVHASSQGRIERFRGATE